MIDFKECGVVFQPNREESLYSLLKEKRNDGIKVGIIWSIFAGKMSCQV